LREGRVGDTIYHLIPEEEGFPVPPVRKQRRDSAEGRRAFLKSAIKGLAALFGLLIATAAALSLIPRGGSGRREMRLLPGDGTT